MGSGRGVEDSNCSSRDIRPILRKFPFEKGEYSDSYNVLIFLILILGRNGVIRKKSASDRRATKTG